MLYGRDTGIFSTLNRGCGVFVAGNATASRGLRKARIRLLRRTHQDRFAVRRAGSPVRQFGAAVLDERVGKRLEGDLRVPVAMAARASPKVNRDRLGHAVTSSVPPRVIS